MIIDFHTHIFPSFFRNKRSLFFPGESAFESLYKSPESKLLGREDLLKDMDKEGVHKSVIFGFPWENEDHFQRHNDYILESVERYPDRFVGFGCFSPLSPAGSKEAERCLGLGLSGVGELALYHSDSPFEDTGFFRDIMEICLKHDAPLLLHVNEPVGHQYPGKTRMSLTDLYNFLKGYPSNRIVLAHWGGGLFFYGLMKKEVREVLTHVWFDTAASPFLYRPDIYRVAGEIVGYDKILFGSDYPLLKPRRYFEEMYSAGLSAQQIEKITGANAEGLLRLKTEG
ncbi:MAG: amidohydrolase family protein [Deltaproteobacteria bacterium]|nr:amidohydrolase family protein [Deltaproteobacteria bacterium]